MLASILPSSHDTSAMQSEAHHPIHLGHPRRHRLDPHDRHTRRTEVAYAVCVFAAGVLLLITAV